MDYRYIEQLLERYWRCETSLQEEEILRTFFSQDDVPSSLLPYRALFAYQQTEKEENVLDEAFDKKVLSMIDDAEPVKARVITMRQRLMPLFKAAAVVAIFLTLGNAVQEAFVNENATKEAPSVSNYGKPKEGPSVAKADSVNTDTLQHKVQPSVTTLTK